VRAHEAVRPVSYPGQSPRALVRRDARAVSGLFGRTVQEGRMSAGWVKSSNTEESRVGILDAAALRWFVAWLGRRYVAD